MLKLLQVNADLLSVYNGTQSCQKKAVLSHNQLIIFILSSDNLISHYAKSTGDRDLEDFVMISSFYFKRILLCRNGFSRDIGLCRG
ncbi:MAG: hypothetical protein V3V22_03890 [Methylococcales bacterium]